MTHFTVVQMEVASPGGVEPPMDDPMIGQLPMINVKQEMDVSVETDLSVRLSVCLSEFV